MKKNYRYYGILLLALFLFIFLPEKQASSQSTLYNQYQVTIDSAAHLKYGLYYPVTYNFSFPSGYSNLTAQYRYNPTDAWNDLPLRTSSDFFNGIDAARFDYGSHTAYLSVAFSSSSDAIYLRVLDGQSEVPISYLGIPQYYDNRRAAVTVTLDDWNAGANAYYNTALQVTSGLNVYTSVGIISWQSPDWNLVQQWVNSGFVEAASHTRQHPCEDWAYEAATYTSEISGSRDDILGHLTLANEYVPLFIEPCGYETSLIRQAIIDAGYLAVRGFPVPPTINTFAPWQNDGAYQSALYTYDTQSWGWDSLGTAQLRDEANSSFDLVYASGGIYHLVDHPNHNLWGVGSYLREHIQHIANHPDAWYVPFGAMYLYHYVQERGMVNISPVSGTESTVTPTATPTAPSDPTPTPSGTPEPTATPTAPSDPTPTPSGTPVPTATPTVTQLPVDPAMEYSLWNGSTTPAYNNVGDGSPLELGVKFSSQLDGYITGLRFYKGFGNYGQHTGHLWSGTGQQLAEAVFTNESASGWQTVYFAAPVAVSANTTYVASYFSNVGFFATTRAYFGTGYSNYPLQAPSSNQSGGNGVYRYGASSVFPDQSFEESNYWVDPIFRLTDAQLPTPTSSPTPVPTATVQPTPVAGVEYSLWNSSVTPVISNIGDATPVELGVKIRATVNGYISGLRFYKGLGNNGQHIGHLWSSAGQQLAEVVFTNESTSGWETAYFSAPVAVTVGETYVVSYFASGGNFAVDRSYFEVGYTSYPLYAPSSGEAGGNGMYHYGPNGGFPDQSYQASNYWVDPIFQTNQ